MAPPQDPGAEEEAPVDSVKDVAQPEEDQNEPLPEGELDAPIDFNPSSEAEKFIYAPKAKGPGDMPTRTHIGSLQGESPPPPRDIHKWLPDLARAARDPDAPPQLKGLFVMVMHHLNQYRDNT